MNRNDELFEAEIAKLIQDEYAHAQQTARVPPAELIWLRAEMRDRRAASPPRDEPAFARAVGAAYRQLWQRPLNP